MLSRVECFCWRRSQGHGSVLASNGGFPGQAWHCRIGLPSGEGGLLLFATDGRYLDPLTISLHKAQVYSQNYEDGIIAEIYRRIGVRGRTFLEIGVENGLQNNTRFLLEQGWRGTWVDSEGNAAEARSLFAEHVASGALRVIGAHVTAENVNEVLDSEKVPKEGRLPFHRHRPEHHPCLACAEPQSARRLYRVQRVVAAIGGH